MKNSLATSTFLIGLMLTGGCASNLTRSLSPDDAMVIPNVEPAGTRVAGLRNVSDTQAADQLVTTNMKAAVIVVGLSQMSRLVDSARGQSN